MKTFNLIIILLSVAGLVATFFSPTLATVLWALPIGVVVETAYKELLK